jgi:hypothetical protein
LPFIDIALDFWQLENVSRGVPRGLAATNEVLLLHFNDLQNLEALLY